MGFKTKGKKDDTHEKDSDCATCAGTDAEYGC